MKQKNAKRPGAFSRGCYRVLRRLVLWVYPSFSLEGLENLPETPCVIVGNHTQMNGPLVAELYLPGDRSIWCAHQMMQLKEVPAYAFTDFWSGKPRWTHGFYRLASYAIAPLATCLFNNAHTIPVYHDARVISTFRLSMQRLDEGANIVIYPEHAVPHNHIVYDFQDKFIDIARLYYKRTGKTLSFVPMYIAPELRRVRFGKPIAFRPEAEMDEERRRICDSLMADITTLAEALPRHRVVPYSNFVPKKERPFNLPE